MKKKYNKEINCFFVKFFDIVCDFYFFGCSKMKYFLIIVDFTVDEKYF